MKIGVTGFEGKVGSELVKWGCEPLDVDIRHTDSVMREIIKVSPDIIINCAAITSVQDCEENHVVAMEVNSSAISNIMDEFGGSVILLSSDHVFSGRRSKNCLWREHDTTIPVNRYGMTKKIMEEVCPTWRITDGKTVVVRTSKLFNDDDLDKFREAVSASSITYEFTNVLERTFMYVPHFVRALLTFIRKDLKYFNETILHISGTEVCTHYQFWKTVAETFSAEDRIIPRNHELEDEIPRPILGGLDTTRAKELGLPLYSYREGISAWNIQKMIYR